jgi:hypothetical protein
VVKRAVVLALVAAAGLSSCRPGTAYTVHNPCPVPVDVRVYPSRPDRVEVGEGGWQTVPARFSVEGVALGRARHNGEVFVVVRTGSRAGELLAAELGEDSGAITATIPEDACPPADGGR